MGFSTHSINICIARGVWCMKSDNIVWRVMYRDENNKIHEEKFHDEDEAKVRFLMIDKPNRTKQLDMIKEAKFYSLFYEVIK